MNKNSQKVDIEKTLKESDHKEFKTDNGDECVLRLKNGNIELSNAKTSTNSIIDFESPSDPRGHYQVVVPRNIEVGQSFQYHVKGTNAINVPFTHVVDIKIYYA